MWSASEVSRSKKHKKRTCLLDLADALLVAILDCAWIELTDVVRFGAVNKRFHRLHFLVTRLSADVEPGPGDQRLLKFLKSMVRSGGCLRELNVNYEYQIAPPVDSPHPLHWLELVSDTLHRLRVEQMCASNIAQLKQLGEMICCCTKLVTLDLFSDDGNLQISLGLLEQVVASCTRLQSLKLYVNGGEMKLSSSSLQNLVLGVGVSATLDTPALVDLVFYGEGLIICSHALKQLKICVEEEEPLFSIRISPPLANLELLSLECEFTLERMEQVLANIPGGCIDTLQLNTRAILIDDSVNLAFFLEPLARLRSLKISSYFMEALAKRRNREQTQTLKRLGVEEMEVTIDALDYMNVGMEDHYQFVGHVMIQLRRFLSNPLLRKLVIDCGSLEYSLEEGSQTEVVNGCRNALKDLVESLVKEFPKVVSIRHCNPLLLL